MRRGTRGSLRGLWVRAPRGPPLSQVRGHLASPLSPPLSPTLVPAGSCAGAGRIEMALWARPQALQLFDGLVHHSVAGSPVGTLPIAMPSASSRPAPSTASVGSRGFVEPRLGRCVQPAVCGRRPGRAQPMAAVLHDQGEVGSAGADRAAGRCAPSDRGVITTAPRPRTGRPASGTSVGLGVLKGTPAPLRGTAGEGGGTATAGDAAGGTSPMPPTQGTASRWGPPEMTAAAG